MEEWERVNRLEFVYIDTEELWDSFMKKAGLHVKIGIRCPTFPTHVITIDLVTLIILADVCKL
jgi:hypothetical protein